MSSTQESHPYSELTKPDSDNNSTIGYETISGDETWQADYLYENKRKWYKHLNEINEGLKNGPTWWNDEYQTHFSNVDLIGIIADTLDLTVSQRREIEPRFTSYDLGEMGLSKELVGCSLCLYLVHEDDTDDRECHPNVQQEGRDEIYDTAIDVYRIFEKDLRKTYGKVDYKERMRDKRGI